MEIKILAITQARYGSTRLPGKVLKTILGKTLLEIHLERILQSERISKIKVATTDEPQADLIVAIADKLGIQVYKGSVDNVLERFYFAALSENPDYVVRVTSDCPLIDAKVIDEVIETCIKGKYDYVSNTLEPTFPDGIDVEVFKFSSLATAYRNASLKSDMEHVTPYIWRNSSSKGGKLFSSFCLKYPKDYSKYRLTVDVQKDFELIENVIEHQGLNQGWLNYVKYLDSNPTVFNLTATEIRNEGYQKSLNND